MHTNANKSSQLAKWLKAYIPNLIEKKEGKNRLLQKEQINLLRKDKLAKWLKAYIPNLIEKKGGKNRLLQKEQINLLRKDKWVFRATNKR